MGPWTLRTSPPVSKTIPWWRPGRRGATKTRPESRWQRARSGPANVGTTPSRDPALGGRGGPPVGALPGRDGVPRPADPKEPGNEGDFSATP